MVKGRESLFRPAHVAHEGIRSGQVRQGEHACGVFGRMNDRHYTTHVELRYFCPHPCVEPETRATRTSTTTVPRCSTPLDFWRCPLHQPHPPHRYTSPHHTPPHTHTPHHHHLLLFLNHHHHHHHPRHLHHHHHDDHAAYPPPPPPQTPIRLPTTAASFEPEAHTGL